MRQLKVRHVIHVACTAWVWPPYGLFFYHLIEPKYIFSISIRNSNFTCLDSYVRLRSLQHNPITDLSRIVTSGIGNVYEL